MLSSSFMAVLVVAALFWGNCFSCPQVLLALQSHQPAHGCCHRTKPVSTDCHSQGLRHFVQADPQPPAALAVAELVEPVSPVSLTQGAMVAPARAEHAPPDLLSLHSTFRI